MDGQRVYIGPTIPHLGLLKSQVYLGGIPGTVRAAIEKHPEIEELIVPIDDIDAARMKAATKGEHLHHIVEELRRKEMKG